MTERYKMRYFGLIAFLLIGFYAPPPAAQTAQPDVAVHRDAAQKNIRQDVRQDAAQQNSAQSNIALPTITQGDPQAVPRKIRARQHSAHALAVPTQPHFLVKRIDYLIIADWHQTSQPWSGYFQAVNGKFFSTPEFYKSTDIEFNIKTAWELRRTANMKASLAIHYDHGYRSALYNVDPYLGLGLSYYYAAGRRNFFTLHILDILQTGGRVKERPCYDTFRRAFHCGTGQAWTDVQNELDGRKVEPLFTARWLHRF